MTIVSNHITSLYQYMSKSKNIAKYMTDTAIYQPLMNSTHGKLYVSHADLQNNRKQIMRITVDDNNILSIENENIPQVKKYTYNVDGYSFSDFDK
jgi:hypothetical protein